LSETTILLIVLPVFLLIAGSMWWFSPLQVAKRRLQAVPATEIGRLRPGERRKVSGAVVLDTVLLSPLDGRRCAYWCATVEEKRDKGGWVEVGALWEGVPFWVEEPTGRVRVDPGVDRLALAGEGFGCSGVQDDPSPEEADLLARMGLSATGLLGLNRTLSYKVAALEEGEQVAVLGTVELVAIGGEPAVALVSGEEGLTVSDAADVHQ